MGQKSRVVPIEIKRLEALNNRVKKQHPKKPEIYSSFRRRMAGFNGEQSIDYYLSFLTKKDFIILHGIRLPSGQYFFQIDTLILTPHFIVILEVKTYSCTIIIDHENSQLTVLKDSGEEKTYMDPVVQVEHQHYQFSKWLQNHKSPRIPIFSYVVFTNDSSKIVSKNNTPISKKNIRSTILFKTIKKLQKDHNTTFYSTKDLNRLKRLIKKHHTSSDRDFVESFGIEPIDIMTGVQCPHCEQFPMERSYGKWICHFCNKSSKDAHTKALQEYLLLFNSSITINEMKKFLHIESREVVKYIIQSLGLKGEGKTRDRKYYLKSLMD